MSKILQYSKAELLSQFSITPCESLPTSFQALISSLPIVFSKESLNPYSSIFPFNGDDAVLPTIKPISKSWGKPAFFNEKNTQFHQINQINSQVLCTKTHSSDNYNSFNYKARNLIRTPFSSSGFSTDLGERVWFYIDEQNEIQGPFTTFEMDNWFEKGYLFDELKICHAANNKFFPLYELFVERTSKSSSNIEAEENIGETHKTQQVNSNFVSLNNPNSINNSNNIQQNIASLPIHPNFNPLLSQPPPNNQKTPTISEQNIDKKNAFPNNFPVAEPIKLNENPNNNSHSNLNNNNNNNNLKKETSENIEKVQSSRARTSDPEIKPIEELKTSNKLEYVRVYEPKKPLLPEDPAKKPEDLEFSSDVRLVKDLKQHKSNVDKDKYYVVYMPKPKESGKLQENEELKQQRKTKKKNTNTNTRKQHSSNTPEKRASAENEKFNTQFYAKESKVCNKNSKQFVVKEYTVKK